MASWKDFATQAPDLAAFGGQRLGGGKVAYLATARSDGGPRVHPVTPVIGDELYLFMEPTSPKGKDLQADPRYQLHCTVEDSSGGSGEFYVRGHATFVADPAVRAAAIAASSYAPADRYILFVLSVDFAFMNVYAGGKANPQRWQSNSIKE
jgi:hypothetical protein